MESARESCEVTGVTARGFVFFCLFFIYLYFFATVVLVVLLSGLIEAAVVSGDLLIPFKPAWISPPLPRRPDLHHTLSSVRAPLVTASSLETFIPPL